MREISCPLCWNTGRLFYQNQFYSCGTCLSIFRDPKSYLGTEKEKARYVTHNNDIHDLGYQNFVSPITSRVLTDFPPESHGLDYGAGPWPVITHLLREKWYTLSLYDPYFYPGTRVLEKKYDYIVCSEVMEHFYQPYAEFKKLASLLKPHWKLYLKTELYHEWRDFSSWYYKNDPTHVFFYHARALKYIETLADWKLLEYENGCIVYEKGEDLI